MVLGNAIDVKDGEMPFYNAPPDDEKYKKPDPSTLIQGSGSGMDADTIDSIQAVTAAVAGPNVLVATDATGKLPSGIIPGGTGITLTTGTYGYLQANPPSGYGLGLATNQGKGTLYFYLNDITAGDHGWILLGGG